jgi:hypothetical protein
VLAYEGSLVFPGAWQAEWSRKHPFGVPSGSRRDAMTMCPGTGLLSHVIERGLVAAAHAAAASAPGDW